MVMNIAFDIPEYHRQNLINGWDEIALTLQLEDKIRQYEETKLVKLSKCILEECGVIGDLLTGEKVYKALERLKPIVHRTPLITSETTNKIVQ